MEAFADLPDALVRDLLAKAVPVIEARALHVRAAQQAARTHARRAGMEDMA